MPKFLEDKLRAEYGNNPHAIYGTMNKLGAMHGNKETAKGKRMQAKHERDSHVPEHKTAAAKRQREALRATTTSAAYNNRDRRRRGNR